MADSSTQEAIRPDEAPHNRLSAFDMDLRAPGFVYSLVDGYPLLLLPVEIRKLDGLTISFVRAAGGKWIVYDFAFDGPTAVILAEFATA